MSAEENFRPLRLPRSFPLLADFGRASQAYGSGRPYLRHWFCLAFAVLAMKPDSTASWRTFVVVAEYASKRLQHRHMATPEVFGRQTFMRDFDDNINRNWYRKAHYHFDD